MINWFDFIEIYNKYDDKMIVLVKTTSLVQ